MQSPRGTTWTLALAGALMVGAMPGVEAAEGPVQFNRDVRPILSDQ
jgi:hypothetical protein